jgi:DNA-binding NarL/FixJ family response regulator
MNESSPITILIVDDHFVVRNGLATSLEIESDIRVTATAERGEDAPAIYASHQPTVVLMDLQLPGINGVETTAAIREIDPAARILVFSTFARMDEIQSALQAGATGYLQKSASREELIHAVRLTAAGEHYLPPEVAAELIELRLGPSITAREREIISLIAAGSANKEIGSKLGIAEDTVKQHVSRILQKLGVKDRAQAATEAIRRGIIRL